MGYELRGERDIDGAAEDDTTVTFRVERKGTLTRASITQSGSPISTRDDFAAAWPDVFDTITTRLAGE